MDPSTRAPRPVARRTSAAAQRNRGPLLEVLRARLPQAARVLEIASGTGEHAVHFVAAMPAWRWQPSDPDPDSLASIRAWAASDGHGRVADPLALDVRAPVWPVEGRFDAVLCCNMIHISPWETTPALMAGAARHLMTGGVLFLYGPFFVDGQPAAEGNLRFDADLRSRDPSWGVRRLSDVRGAAGAAGLVLREAVPMPANNLTLVFDAP